MKKIIATATGLLVGGLAAAHFVTKGKRLFGLDTEKAISLARVPIAASLLHAGTMKEEKDANRVLGSVGASYLGMGGGALLDHKLGGTFKMGFNKTDIAFHLVTGAALLAISLLPTKDSKASE
jgi:hypothetical protein